MSHGTAPRSAHGDANGSPRILVAFALLFLIFVLIGTVGSWGAYRLDSRIVAPPRPEKAASTPNVLPAV